MPANARQIETRTSETAEADAGSENRLIVVAVCTVWLRCAALCAWKVNQAGDIVAIACNADGKRRRRRRR